MDAEAEVIKRTIAATCEKLAQWLEVGEAMAARAIAADVEKLDGSETVCPVCQETTCDDDCPLAPVRNRHPDEDSEAEWRARVEVLLLSIQSRLNEIPPART